jgi:glyoxylase-like metal-dependent hydrolase (beta-lactamase superfamily II)
MARMGSFAAAGVTEVQTFTGDTDLNVPGGLRAVPTPGHTPGSTSYLLPHAQAIFTGDALVTHDAIGGHRGPCVICLAVTHDGTAAMTSLRRLSELDATAIYPGHGEPLHQALHTAATEAIAYGLH